MWSSDSITSIFNVTSQCRLPNRAAGLIVQASYKFGEGRCAAPVVAVLPARAMQVSAALKTIVVDQAVVLGNAAPLVAQPVERALSFAPEEHDKDHARHGQNRRYEFHPASPWTAPKGPRGEECRGLLAFTSRIDSSR
jgi:hypothetical protein